MSFPGGESAKSKKLVKKFWKEVEEDALAAYGAHTAIGPRILKLLAKENPFEDEEAWPAGDCPVWKGRRKGQFKQVFYNDISDIANKARAIVCYSAENKLGVCFWIRAN